MEDKRETAEWGERRESLLELIRVIKRGQDYSDNRSGTRSKGRGVRGRTAAGIRPGPSTQCKECRVMDGDSLQIWIRQKGPEVCCTEPKPCVSLNICRLEYMAGKAVTQGMWAIGTLHYFKFHRVYGHGNLWEVLCRWELSPLVSHYRLWSLISSADS